MNVWQYSRWVYLIGRSIKNKSLEPSEREAFIVFIDGILKYRPYLMPKLNIKKGNGYKEWENQNDYSLGKMLQVIGRNLKQLSLTIEEKVLCDRLFYYTDERRFMTYNKYLALSGKQIFVTVEDNLTEIVNNCTPYSTIVLSSGEYNYDIDIYVDGTVLRSDENAVIIGRVTNHANDVTLENITLKSQQPLRVFPKKEIVNMLINQVSIASYIEVISDMNNFIVQNSEINGGGNAFVFNGIGNGIYINSCEINGNIVFNSSLDNAIITNNVIVSEKGIVFNGSDDGNIYIEENEFNWEK